MKHYGFAAVSDSVPVFAVSSISKRFLVPGWRLGWLIVHDRRGIVSKDMRQALVSLTQRILGPCSLLQGALPEILKVIPDTFYEKTNNLLEVNVTLAVGLLNTLKSLTLVNKIDFFYSWSYNDVRTIS